MNVKLGICNFCVPGTGVFAPQIVAEMGLDGMSLEFGSYERWIILENLYELAPMRHLNPDHFALMKEDIRVLKSVFKESNKKKANVN